MLGLDQAALLLDGLKPPAGMEIDLAVGTTFTLDLSALLAVPVAATFAAAEDAEDGAGLLETIRRYADRTILFCQAGAMAVPARYRAAMTFVERSVVEIRKPAGGIFHPKVWVVRFVGGGTRQHRVLVLSRNLTFDRSWDVIVRLDQAAGSDTSMDSSGAVEFLRALPSLAARGVSDAQSTLVEDLASSLSEARLAVPGPFESGALVPLLGSGRGTPFRDSCDRALAISPFLTEGAARSFIETASAGARILSRRAALDASASGLRVPGGPRLMRLKDAVIDAERTIDDTFDVAGGDDPAAAMSGLRGLHAKVYVQDHGDKATCWMGSANLTSAAFSTNVEMMVELTGPVGSVGADVLLTAEPEKNNLSWFVEDHLLAETNEGTDAEEGLTDAEQQCLDVASCDITVTLSQVGELWDAALTIAERGTSNATIRARLLSLESDALVDVVDGAAAWRAIPESLITPFVVLEIRAGGTARRTLVRARLVGDPPDRRQAVIANAISSRDDFFRYLAALLGLDVGLGVTGGVGEGIFGDGWTGRADSGRILEDLLTTASREPARLSSLGETLTQLLRRPDMAEIVPEDFRELWDAVHAARKVEIG